MSKRLALACRHLHIIKPHPFLKNVWAPQPKGDFGFPNASLLSSMYDKSRLTFIFSAKIPLPATPYACLYTNLRTSASAHLTSHSVSCSSGTTQHLSWKATLLANKTTWHAAENLPFLITLAFLFRLAGLMVKEARFGSCVDIRSRSYVTSCSREKLRWPRLSIETVLLSLEVE